jgi:large subunit ribosomal protein L17
MRHNVKGRKLGRNASHRRAMMRNMVTNLFRNGSIKTTVAKAKETRPCAEKLITRAISGNLADKRALIEFLNDRTVAHHLINDIAKDFEGRKGGYLRIIKLGPRLGDGAEMAILELVVEEHEKKKKRSSKKSKNAATKADVKKDKAAESSKEKSGDDSSITGKHEEKTHKRDEQAKEHLSAGSKAQGTRRSSKPAMPKQAVVNKGTSLHKTPPPSSQES